MSKKIKESLADRISGILTATPTSFDPEDDVTDVTKAPLSFNEDEHVSNDEEEEILSKFRKENVDLLADLDDKYAGKKSSRQNLKDSDSEDLSASENDDEEEEEDESSEETAEEEENSDEEVEDESESDFDDENLVNEEDNSNFKHLNEANVSNQLKKAISVRNQMTMWESLLEVRIQLQKCLITSNKMPQNNDFKQVKQQLDPEYSTKLADTKQNVASVLNKLVTLQNMLLKQYPETKKLNDFVTDTDKDDAGADDEEIASDTEPENSEVEDSSEKVISKKRKLEEFEKDISQQYVKYKKYRDNVIQKWNDKTRIGTKGASTTTNSILSQIEYNLSNRDKLVKRTQLKRSQYDVVGKELNQRENDDELNSKEVVDDYDSEIFDDDDFYHQLLRELIEVKSADVTDPVQLGRQWIQLQNLRNKMKRKIDTRATKGRKIRYAIHTKLVNFMAPIDHQQWTDEAKTELYNSLFGKNQIVSNN